MIGIATDVQEFFTACEAIHALLEHKPLSSDDRDLVKFSCFNLLSKLKPNYAALIQQARPGQSSN